MLNQTRTQVRAMISTLPPARRVASAPLGWAVGVGKTGQSFLFEQNAVGGIASAADVENRLRAGSHHVQIATAAMLNPMIAIQIRQALAPSHVG